MRYRLNPKGKFFSEEVNGIAQPTGSVDQLSVLIVVLEDIKLFCNWSDTSWKSKRDVELFLPELAQELRNKYEIK